MFDKERLQKFSIRKLTVGAASVLIGVTFMSQVDTHKVYAEVNSTTISAPADQSQKQNGR